MLFGNRKINDDIHIEIDNAEIKRVNENKFLGVLIDHKLCWSPILNTCVLRWLRALEY